jgi:hypothetical protein
MRKYDRKYCPEPRDKIKEYTQKNREKLNARAGRDGKPILFLASAKY